MCTGNMPDPLGVFKSGALPDPLNVHTPTPEQVALKEAKERQERLKAEGLTPKDEPKSSLRIQRTPAAAPKKRKSSLRIDLQSPGSSSAGGPPTLGA